MLLRVHRLTLSCKMLKNEQNLAGQFSTSCMKELIAIVDVSCKENYVLNFTKVAAKFQNLYFIFKGILIHWG